MGKNYTERGTWFAESVPFYGRSVPCRLTNLSVIKHQIVIRIGNVTEQIPYTYHTTALPLALAGGAAEGGPVLGARQHPVRHRRPRM